MKRVSLILGVVIVLYSCAKEYSLENGTGDSDLIIGVDCRISKIAATDTASNLPLGSIMSTINSSDQNTDITAYDSLSATVLTNSQPTYTNDTVYVNPDEYFIVDLANSKRIIHQHRLADPLDPTSPQIEVAYNYNAAGNLIQKVYQSSFFGPLPFYQVDYTFVGGNLTNMLTTDLTTAEPVSDAAINFFPNIAPKNYLYIFPDEYVPEYAQYNQYFNFGKRSTNAIRDIKIRNYSGGLLTSDSTKTVFGSYTMSRDNYVLSVIMSGDELPSIPSQKGKLKFSYHCK